MIFRPPVNCQTFSCQDQVNTQDQCLPSRLRPRIPLYAVRLHVCTFETVNHPLLDGLPLNLSSGASKTMEDPNSLEGFQALYADLVALSEKRLADPERLSAQLEAIVPAFKSLLDKRTRNEESRRSLATGMYTLKRQWSAANPVDSRATGCRRRKVSNQRRFPSSIATAR